MDFNQLLGKYHTLQNENRLLKEKIKQLENQFRSDSGILDGQVEEIIKNQDKVDNPKPQKEEIEKITIDKQSSPQEKISLFMSLFKGREDVYAIRWKNKKKGSSGYSPVCGNEWLTAICQKPKIHQKFAIIDQKIVWYGSINLLSYGSAEENMMQIESTKIAYELINSVEKP